MQIEITKALADLFHAALPADEVEAALNELMLANIDDMDTFQEFLEALAQHNGDMTRIVGMTHQPVPMEQFLEDTYFLGKIFTPYSGVRDMLLETVKGGYVQWLGTGAIGIGKTTAAQVLIARGIYELSCERFPQARLGLMPTSSIVFAMMNKTSDLAKAVTFGEFHQFLSAIPYFQDEFAFDADVKSVMQFPNRIRVEYSAADAQQLLGKNIIGGILDEMNFQARIEKSKQAVNGGFYDQAATVYTGIVSRRRSRFERLGRVPGVLCVVSSANYAGDFTDRLKQKIKEEADGLSYVWDESQWNVLPANRFGPGRWRLEIGTERHKSRILSDADTPRPGAKVMSVPMEYLKRAKEDFDQFMRDDAGIVTVADRPFFYDIERIWRMGDMAMRMGLKSPLAMHESWCLADGMPPIDPGFSVANPNCKRSIHIDLGVTGDACGFAMGYVDGTEAVTGRDSKGSRLVEEMPRVVYDCFLQIKAPKGGEIEFSEVRELIYLLTDLGFPIEWVTFDGFQSVDSRQILRRNNYKTDLVSVEGKEAYEALRTAIWQSRVIAPEHHICFNELAFLKEDREKQRVDHLPNKAKDVSDAMCGVYKNLMNQRASWYNPLPVFQVQDQKTGMVRPVLGPTTQVIHGSGRRDIQRRDIVRK